MLGDIVPGPYNGKKAGKSLDNSTYVPSTVYLRPIINQNLLAKIEKELLESIISDQSDELAPDIHDGINHNDLKKPYDDPEESDNENAILISKNFFDQAIETSSHPVNKYTLNQNDDIQLAA